jgi:hypothetical protein
MATVKIAAAPAGRRPLRDSVPCDKIAQFRNQLNKTKQSKKNGFRHRQEAEPLLVRLSNHLQAAILLVMDYVAQTTGIEPSQEEIATVLKSYFTLDEVTNQINYLRKKPPVQERPGADSGFRAAPMRINLMIAPNKNPLARAGFFIRPIAEAVAEIRKHANAALGVAPSDEDIALSLKSNFILSELKNQIVHIRQQPSEQG